MAIDPLQSWIERWGLLSDGEAFTTRFGSRLMPVLRGDEAAMLKIAGHEEERRGGALMEWYGGVGAARVLAREGEALLLERLTGSRSLSAMARAGADDEATRILCQVGRALHVPRPVAPPPSLIPLEVWFRALQPAAAQHGGAFGKAATAAEALFRSPQEPVVLHGDLHHDNVLDGGDRRWLVIDPKGLIGERTFEYANLFRNPDAGLALEPGRMRRRAGLVADRAGVETRRLLQWVLAYAGLGAAWSLQSGEDPESGLAIAEMAAAELAV